MTLQGLDGVLVNVEVDVSAGMPMWSVVGLPDTGVREAKDRIKTAIKNCGIELSSRKYIINLSPADIRKEGSGFDLAIAIGILKNIGVIKNFNGEDALVVGELSLDGKINKKNGILPMCIEAIKKGIKEVIVPYENAKEAALVKGLRVIGVKDLKEVIDYLNCEKTIFPEKVEIDSILESLKDTDLDFSEVKGQKVIKRALEVCATGAHNCLLIGSPGSGKTMMAKRLPTILPDLTFEESLEITKIHSITGRLDNQSLITKRPFRSPHHTITETALIGGGKIPKPGEVSLAHLGVLFLDELLEFSRNTLEVLRIPIEDRKVNISRVGVNILYPSNFMLVASMNPCPCGYYGDMNRECTCTENQRKLYQSKLSGPMLDRFDIHIKVPSIKYKDLKEENDENSSTIRERVNKARKIQQERYIKEGIYSNSELTPKLIKKYCILEDKANKILNLYFEKMKLSTRSYSKILKVSRTIADLDNEKIIRDKHILEAIQYRSLDKL